MKTPKAPTALQLFKQWKKVKLASDKANAEKDLLRQMAYKISRLDHYRITVDGFIYELTVNNSYNSWNTSVEVKQLGSVEEFANLIK